jgi:hypothetical protein
MQRFFAAAVTAAARRSGFTRGGSTALFSTDAAAASEPPPLPFASNDPDDAPPPRRRPRARIETHGCQSNVADSEVVARVLSDAGYDAGPHVPLNDADVVLVNTCAIREGAEAKILAKLGGALRDERRARRQRQQAPQQQLGAGQQLKGGEQQHQQPLDSQQQQQQPGALVVGVLGCMAERLRAKLLDSDRLADVVAGPDAYRDLPRLLDAARVRVCVIVYDVVFVDRWSRMMGGSDFCCFNTDRLYGCCLT